MKILTLENATKEDLEGTYHKGINSTFEYLKSLGFTPMNWITEQNPPIDNMHKFITIKNGIIDLRKEHNAKDICLSFEEKVKESLPKELFFPMDHYDSIGIRTELIKVKSNYAYYAKCEGSSSKIFDVHIPKLIKYLDKGYFTSKESLKKEIIKRHEAAILRITNKINQD